MKVGDLVELSARGMDLKEFRHINWNRLTPTGRKRMIGIITEVKQCVLSWGGLKCVGYDAGYMVKWFDGTSMYRFSYVRNHLKMAR